jgi:hypothetical protein
VLLALLGFAAGASYLYHNGLLGGKPSQDSLAAPASPDTPRATISDSDALRDSALLSPELSRFDSAFPPEAAPFHPAAAAGAPSRSPETVSGDSGTLQIKNLPPRTQVFVDARPVTQAGAGIRIPPGWHELGVSAPGFQFYTDSIHVEPGKTMVVTPNLSATNSPTPAPGSRAEMRRRVLARLDCENPTPANRFGAQCYDSRPQPLGSTRVSVPAGVRGVPSNVVLVVKVSLQGRTLALRTRVPSNEPAFTKAVEDYAAALRWTPPMRDGEPVDGWTQAAFVPDTP